VQPWSNDKFGREMHRPVATGSVQPVASQEVYSPEVNGKETVLMGDAPVGFVVSGKPRVQGSKSREAWKDEVRRAAPCRDDWLEGPLYLRVDYFFNGETDLDLDNMIKPIQDALKNCIYEDDKTIHEVHARKFNRNDYDLTWFDFDAAASGVQTAPDQPEEFVFVTVAQLPKGPTGDRIRG